MNRKRCLVLGGSGFLGREAVPELRREFEVTATAMNHAVPGMLTADLRDPIALEELIRATEPQAVVALAAYREPDFCEEHPEEARRLNTHPYGTLNRLLPPDCPLLLVSTDYVFDGDRPPYAESTPVHPLSVYGQSKVEAEARVLERENAVVLRVPLLMGWTDDPLKSGFFSQLVNDLRAGSPVMLDDVLARYPVWTRDVGRAMRALLTAGASGIFHYSTARKLTRYQAALEMGAITGLSADHIRPSREIIMRKARRPVDARLITERWDASIYPEPLDFGATARQFIAQFGLTS